MKQTVIELEYIEEIRELKEEVIILKESINELKVMQREPVSLISPGLLTFLVIVAFLYRFFCFLFPIRD